MLFWRFIFTFHDDFPNSVNIINWEFGPTHPTLRLDRLKLTVCLHVTSPSNLHIASTVTDTLTSRMGNAAHFARHHWHNVKTLTMTLTDMETLRVNKPWRFFIMHTYTRFTSLLVGVYLLIMQHISTFKFRCNKQARHRGNNNNNCGRQIFSDQS